MAPGEDLEEQFGTLWNKGKMALRLDTTGKHLWLTVAAACSALPVRDGGG